MDEKALRELCEKHRIKFTPQRLAIYKELSRSKDHPSTDQIFQRIRKRFPNISFDTVNRTVLTFADIGVIRVVEGSGGGRCFDPNMDSHHHLQCIKCYKIIDFYNKTYDDLKLPKALPKNFQVLSKKVVLEGLCEKCKPKKGASTS